MPCLQPSTPAPARHAVSCWPFWSGRAVVRIGPRSRRQSATMARSDHDPLAPGGRERVIDRVTGAPRQHDLLDDESPPCRADPRRVVPPFPPRPVRPHVAGIVAVMPRRTGQAGQLQRLALRTCHAGQRFDQLPLGGQESGRSVLVGPSSGSCSFIACKSPIDFPNASLVFSNSRTRAVNRATSAEDSQIPLTIGVNRYGDGRSRSRPCGPLYASRSPFRARQCPRFVTGPRGCGAAARSTGYRHATALAAVPAGRLGTRPAAETC